MGEKGAERKSKLKPKNKPLPDFELHLQRQLELVAPKKASCGTAVSVSGPLR